MHDHLHIVEGITGMNIRNIHLLNSKNNAKNKFLRFAFDLIGIRLFEMNSISLLLPTACTNSGRTAHQK